MGHGGGRTEPHGTQDRAWDTQEQGRPSLGPQVKEESEWHAQQRGPGREPQIPARVLPLAGEAVAQGAAQERADSGEDSGDEPQPGAKFRGVGHPMHTDHEGRHEREGAVAAERVQGRGQREVTEGA